VRHPLTQALLVLTFTAGLIDALSYLGLGRVSTANMTANVVLLGSVSPGVVPPGGRAPNLSGRVPSGSRSRWRAGEEDGGGPSRACGPSARDRGVSTRGRGGASAATSVHPGHASAYVLIVLMAFAMGVRHAAEFEPNRYPGLVCSGCMRCKNVVGVASRGSIALLSGSGDECEACRSLGAGCGLSVPRGASRLTGRRCV
jgi:Protein of unknown function (DUF1275)